MSKFYFDGKEFDNLEDTKKYADDHLSYNPDFAPVITDENGEEVARRTWWGTDVKNDVAEELGKDSIYDVTDAELDDYIRENDYISFGSFGYYSNWIEV